VKEENTKSERERIGRQRRKGTNKRCEPNCKKREVKKKKEKNRGKYGRMG
jgi:hypothetical protein